MSLSKLLKCGSRESNIVTGNDVLCFGVLHEPKIVEERLHRRCSHVKKQKSHILLG